MIAVLAAGCEDSSAPVTPPDPASTGEDLAGVYAGTATFYPGYVLDVGAPGPDVPSTPASESPASIELRDVRPGAGAPVATLDLRIGDAHLVTEVIVIGRGETRQLEATRPVRCSGVETGGRTAGTITTGEITLDEIALEQPCTLGTAVSQLWKFRGSR